MKTSFTGTYIGVKEYILDARSVEELIIKFRGVPSYMVVVTVWDEDSLNEDGTPDIIVKTNLEEIESDILKHGYFDPEIYR